MMIKLPIKKGLMDFSTPKSTIQLVLKVESSSAVTELVNFFTKSVACLHLRYVNDSNLEYKEKVNQYKIPTEITNLREVSLYVGKHFTPSITESFGSIAFNETTKIVALNASHRFCDGGFFKFLLDKFNKIEYPKKPPILPRFTKEIFQKEIEESPVIKPFVNDERIFRFTPNKLAKMNRQSEYSKSYDIKLNATDFKTYDKNKKAPRNLTDLFYLSQYFASSAYKGKLFDKFSVITVIDLRESLNYKPDFLSCYHCAQITPDAVNISPNDRLFDLSNKLKNDLKIQRKQMKHFSMLKATVDENAIVNGIPLCYSAVGVMNIKRPIVDAYVGIIMSCSKPKNVLEASNQIALFNWSVRDDERNKNEFITQIWHNPNVFDEEEMKLYGKRIEFILKNVTLDQKIGEVYDVIKKIK